METTQGYLDILKKHKVKDLDTANLYVSLGFTVLSSSLANPLSAERKVARRLWGNWAHHQASP